MGVGALTITRPGRSPVDVTAYVDRESAVFEFQASRLNGVGSFLLRDETGALSDVVVERADVSVTDDGTKVFGGLIASINRRLEGGARIYEVKAQSYDVLLDAAVIESGSRSGSRYDDDEVIWLTNTYLARFGITASGSVDRVRTDPLPDIDYSGKTVRQALEHLGSYTTGVEFWIDEQKRLRWTDPRSAQLVRNADFEAGSTNWTLDPAAGVVDGAGPGGTGDAALVVTGDGAGNHDSKQTVSVVPGRRYLVIADLWSSASSQARVALVWKTSGGTTIRTDAFDNGGAVSSWTRKKAVYTAPATAATMEVRLGLNSSTSTATSKFDNVMVVGETSGWGVSMQPDGVTTFAVENWSQPSEATQPINRVLVVGDGISGWREHAASIAYYGDRYEAILQDDRVTTDAGIDARAAWLFSKYAFPSVRGTYTTRRAIQAGTWQILEVQPFGITAIEWIATVRMGFDGAGNMVYEVTYGAPEEDVGSVVAALSSVFSGVVVEPGVAPPGVDTVAPATPTGLTLSSSLIQQPDGSVVVRLLATLTQPGAVDLWASVVEITGDAPNDVPDWTSPMRIVIGKDASSGSIEGVRGAWTYYARAYAEDVNGNRSPYSAVVSHTTVADAEAPPIPVNLAAAGGFRGLAASWDSVGVPDLAYYEVGITPSGGVETRYRVRTTVLWVGDLDPGVVHSVRVRAVDRGGLVRTSKTDPTAVDAIANPEAGWTAPVTATPTLVGASDIAANSILASHISTAGLTADLIKAGTLKVATTDGIDGIEVWYSGKRVGFWDETGLYIGKQAAGLPSDLSGSDYVRVTDAGVTVYKAGQAVTAITPDGINASAINFGVLAGGHNLVRNSSFELTSFAAAPSTATWDVQADWNASRVGTDTNVTTGTGSLTMTGTSY